MIDERGPIITPENILNFFRGYTDMRDTILFIRYLCVASTIEIFRLKRQFTKGAAVIMTWGGLRGGISVAMALSLPQSQYRDIFILITYIVVLFSIIGQGLTVKPMINYFLNRDKDK